MREQKIQFARLKAQEAIKNCFRIALAFGSPLGLLIERAFLPPLVAILLPPVMVLLFGLLIGSLVIYLGLNLEGDPLPAYWRYISFPLLFGLLFFASSIAVRNTLLASVSISL